MNDDRLLAQPSSRHSDEGHWAQVGGSERMAVVGVGDVVTKVGGSLSLAFAVAATNGELLPPHGIGVDCCHGMIVDTKQKLSDEWGAQTVVPRRRFGWEGGGPDLADVGGVVCVVQVEALEALRRLGDVGQREANGVGTGCAVNLAGAAQLAARWSERIQESVLVVRLGVADKGVPLHLAQSSPHSIVVSNTRASLGEKA